MTFVIIILGNATHTPPTQPKSKEEMIIEVYNMINLKKGSSTIEKMRT